MSSIFSVNYLEENACSSNSFEFVPGYGNNKAIFFFVWKTHTHVCYKQYN